MPQYRNLPDGFARIRNGLIFRVAPLLLVGVIAGSLMNYQSEKNLIDFSTSAIVIVVLICVFSFPLFTVIKRQKNIYDSYLLTIETNYLTRAQNGLPLVTIFFDEISETTKDKDGNLIVKTLDGSKQIFIPSSIEKDIVFENLMQTRLKIQLSNTKTFLQKFPYLLPVLAVACMVAVYISNNKIIVLISGASIITFSIWGFYKIRTSPQINSTIKSKSWWMLIVVASVLAIVYYKVFGN